MREARDGRRHEDVAVELEAARVDFGNRDAAAVVVAERQRRRAAHAQLALERRVAVDDAHLLEDGALHVVIPLELALAGFGREVAGAWC